MSELTSDALLLDQDLKLRFGTIVAPAAEEGFARVRLEWAGICGSDLHVLRSGDWVSYWPAVLGHEAVGVVESCPGGELAVGSRVVLDSRVSCGRCDGCRDSPNLCRDLHWVGEAWPGGFQRAGTFPARSLHVCPSGIDPSVAVLAEPLAVAMHAVTLVGDLPDRALILGYGPVGALIHSELVRRNPQMQVNVSEPHLGRAQLARAAGAAVVDGMSGVWPLVVDAAGFPGALSVAVASADVGATVLLVAIEHTEANLRAQNIVEKALRIVGSHGFAGELPFAIDQIAKSPSSYHWLITDAIALEEAPDRLDEMTRVPTVGKAVIRL